MARQAARRRKSGFDYGTLEARQVLTTFIDIGHHLPNINPKVEFSIPLNESQEVITALEEAPEIATQPENGSLEYRESDGVLVYTPDSGFTGLDVFEIEFEIDGEDKAVPFNVRVWESAYATADWKHVTPGQTTTIDVLANDYAFIESENRFSYVPDESGRKFAWQHNSEGFRIVEATAAQFGTLAIADDGQSLVFESESGTAGEQEVTYTIEDARGFRTTGILTIFVSAETLDDRYYINESQWQQEQVEKWLGQYADSMNFQWNVPIQPDGFDHRVVSGHVHLYGRGIDFQLIATVEANGNAFAATGVDVQQGDIVKTHGDVIYYVTHDRDYNSDFRSYLSIVDVSDPNSPMLMSTTGFENRIEDIFLDEDRVAVVASAYADWGIDRHWGYYANELELTVLDVTSPVVPSEVYSATVDGNYTDARLIGDRLYLISQGGTLRATSMWKLRSDVTDPVSPRDYVDALLSNENAFGMPSVTIDIGGETTTTMLEFDQYVRRESVTSGILVTTFDIQNAESAPVDMDLVESNRISTVYVSPQSMYLFGSGSIIKMAFNAEAEVDFAAEGVLEGDLLNEFSASEHDGVLRVAFNDWADRSSDVYVFQQGGDSLDVVGSLENIAPGEQIYSTTFVEDQLFVVTFRQIDPLFVIDLGDATSPTILGELKIPGVSHYLKLIDDDILLAVGRDADMSGRQTSLQVSLFDVADPENSLLLDRYTFDGGSSTDTPLFDFWGSSITHQAATFDQSSGTLALPVSRSGEGDSSGIAVFNLSRENGIRSIGEVGFDNSALRTVISGDRIVYFAEDSIKTANLEAPTDVLADLELPPEESTARGVGAASKVCVHIEPVIETDPVVEPRSADWTILEETDEVFSLMPDFATIDQLRSATQDDADRWR